MVYYESEMVPVCYNDIGRQEAEMLCASSGRGYASLTVIFVMILTIFQK